MLPEMRGLAVGIALLGGLLLPGCGSKSLPNNTNETCVAPAQVVQANISTQLVAAFPQLPALGALVDLMQAPGSDRWYAVTQDGRIYWFNNTGNTSTLNLLLDLRSVVRFSGEMGLLGLAFHPNFVTNHELYVSYNDSRNNGRSTISRFIANGTQPINAASEQIILTVAQPAANHNGGHIVFGPDGMLYIGLGDGGGAGDPFGNGQNLTTLLGKLLRINVTNTTTYTIPADNPWVGNVNARPEIYAYGLRNPWRFSFDQQTGELWLADVGQGNLEEIDIIRKGGNYGWPVMEGTQCYQTANCNKNGLELPVAEYTHTGGDCSVTGGFVYRGNESAVLGGRYVFGDFCTGRIRATTRDVDQQYITQELLLSGHNISGFGESRSGEVYALNYSGGAGTGIYKIHSQGDGSGSTLPATLSATGCFKSTIEKTLNTGVAPYNVTSALWSDGAEKNRYLAIPKDRKIEVLADGDFEFPVGTVLIKNFMSEERYLETRLFMRHQNGWGGYSYEWLPDQSDAVLLDEGKTIDAGDFVHTIPSRSECFTCHTGAAHVSLGIEASQINSTYAYSSGKTDNQNAALYSAGYLSTKPNNSQITTMASVDNHAVTDIALRARSYLHANCSGCHRPGGPMAHMDMRIQTTFAASGLCNAVPIAGTLGIPNARLIAPGDSSRSVLLQRMLAQDESRMPPLASHSVDTIAVNVIAQWIDEMNGCP